MDHFNEMTELPEEYVATWIDGNLSTTEEAAFLEMLSSDSRLAEIMDAYEDIETTFENLIDEGYQISEDFISELNLPNIGADFFEEEPFTYIHSDNLINTGNDIILPISEDEENSEYDEGIFDEGPSEVFDDI